MQENPQDCNATSACCRAMANDYFESGIEALLRVADRVLNSRGNVVKS